MQRPRSWTHRPKRVVAAVLGTRRAAGLFYRSRHSHRKIDPWKFATITGTIGIMLLIFLQISALWKTPPSLEGATEPVPTVEAEVAVPQPLLNQPKPQPDPDLIARVEPDPPRRAIAFPTQSPEPEPPPVQDDPFEPLPEQPVPDPQVVPEIDFPEDRPFNPPPAGDPLDEPFDPGPATQPLPEPTPTPIPEPMPEPEPEEPEFSFEIARVPNPPELAPDIDDEFAVDSAPILDALEDLAAQTPRRGISNAWAGANLSRPVMRPEEPVSYRDRLSADDMLRLRQSVADTFKPTAAHADSPAADAGLVIEKTAPERAVVGDRLQYRIIVQNNGAHSIPTVRVAETLPEGHVVSDAQPPADLTDNTLTWQLQDIPAGERRILTVVLAPQAAGVLNSSAVVTAFAAVGAQTTVKAEALTLEVLPPESPQVGEYCRIRFRVKNVGETTVENIVLRESLPESLEHRLGQKVEYAVGTLEPGEDHETYMIVRPVSAGPVTHNADLLASGVALKQAAEQFDIRPASPDSARRPTGQKPSSQRPNNRRRSRADLCTPCQLPHTRITP